MTKDEMAKEIKKIISTDPKSLYNNPVTIKFNTYEYQMLKELSEIINEPISRIIRQMVFNELIQLKDIDKIN